MSRDFCLKCITHLNFLFSKNTTLDLVDQVFEGHDQDVINLKERTEELWQEVTTKRERRTIATKSVPGFCFFGDNIGTHLVQDRKILQCY